MEQNEKNQDLIDLSEKFADEVENMQNDNAPIQLNNPQSWAWIHGYQAGFQAAIEFIKQKNKK